MKKTKKTFPLNISKQEYCDNCGESKPTHFVSAMPTDFDSGNIGESASLCEDCFVLLTTMEL